MKMNYVQTICVLMIGYWFVGEINGASIQDNLSDNQSKLTRLAYDIKLYVKKLNETNEKFPEEFVKGMDKINEIEQDARKIIETINNIRNTHNEEEYEKNMAIICGTNVP